LRWEFDGYYILAKFQVSKLNLSCAFKHYITTNSVNIRNEKTKKLECKNQWKQRAALLRLCVEEKPAAKITCYSSINNKPTIKFNCILNNVGMYKKNIILLQVDF